MKIGVAGSRTFDNYKYLVDILDAFHKAWGDFTVVSGGAAGADRMAEGWAIMRRLPTEIYKPDWDQYGKGAGFIRNRIIVQHSDILVAFWDGKSKGTANTVHHARVKQIPVYILWPGKENKYFNVESCIHDWEGVWLSDDLEGYRCRKCQKEQVEIEEIEHGYQLLSSP